MTVYGCNLINGTLKTMILEDAVDISLETLCEKIEDYIDNDFQDNYDYEELDYPIYVEVVYGNIDHNIFDKLLKNQDYSGINDMLTREAIVYKPLSARYPCGLWGWKGVS